MLQPQTPNAFRLFPRQGVLLNKNPSGFFPYNSSCKLARPRTHSVFYSRHSRCARLTGAIVKMGCVFDGFAPHMRDQDPLRTFLPLEKESTREQIVAELRDSAAELMVNYLPVGSEDATRFYASCALEAGLGFVNNIPVFIASDPVWAKRFAEKNLPLIGDDIKAQVGATIVHRALVDLFRKRGVKVVRTYQLNTGGNTDFLNMLNRTRLA